MAGLWSHHTWEGERTDSYTTVMMDTAPGDDMHPFHNRQPVVLDRAAARAWLDCCGDYAAVLKALGQGELVADPPSRWGVVPTLRLPIARATNGSR